MKTHCTALFLYALACSGCHHAVSPHLDYPYERTTALAHPIKILMVEPAEFRLAKPEIVASYLCGEYRRESAVDWSAGYILHVFPDFTAIIVKWTDIAPEATVCAEGVWQIVRDGTVVFDWKRWDFDSSVQYFTDGYGQCKTMRLVLGFTNGRLEDVLLISTEMMDAKDTNAFRRDREYIDWKVRENELRSGKG